MRLVFILMGLSLLSTMAVRAQEPRIWTDLKGKQIKAFLVAKTNDSVILKGASGREVNLNISVFCEADKLYIESHEYYTIAN